MVWGRERKLSRDQQLPLPVHSVWVAPPPMACRRRRRSERLPRFWHYSTNTMVQEGIFGKGYSQEDAFIKGLGPGTATLCIVLCVCSMYYPISTALIYIWVLSNILSFVSGC